MKNTSSKMHYLTYVVCLLLFMSVGSVVAAQKKPVDVTMEVPVAGTHYVLFPDIWKKQKLQMSFNQSLKQFFLIEKGKIRVRNDAGGVVAKLTSVPQLIEVNGETIPLDVSVCNVTLSINTREMIFPSTGYAGREYVCDMIIKSMSVNNKRPGLYTATIQIEFNAVL